MEPTTTLYDRMRQAKAESDAQLFEQHGRKLREALTRFGFTGQLEICRWRDTPDACFEDKDSGTIFRLGVVHATCPKSFHACIRHDVCVAIGGGYGWWVCGDLQELAEIHRVIQQVGSPVGRKLPSSLMARFRRVFLSWDLGA